MREREDEEGEGEGEGEGEERKERSLEMLAIPLARTNDLNFFSRMSGQSNWAVSERERA